MKSSVYFVLSHNELFGSIWLVIVCFASHSLNGSFLTALVFYGDFCCFSVYSPFHNVFLVLLTNQGILRSVRNQMV